MKLSLFILTVIFLSIIPLNAKVLTTVEKAIESSLNTHNLQIIKQNILLTKKESNEVEKLAKLKLHSHIVKIYIVKSDTSTKAYGILISRKIRSKNGVVLYLLDHQGKILNIEVIAFNEPLEYLPKGSWEKQFDNLPLDQHPELGRNVTPITGATLSAKSIIEGARIAQALYTIKLKEQ
ncbi:FMN-binding protein [Sulfurimonas sp.]|uniref:FMN-binding protein n=1 Tax=Sulfurimonas sp. TaxID=2022749 RepID=UPI003D0AED4C